MVLGLGGAFEQHVTPFWLVLLKGTSFLVKQQQGQAFDWLQTSAAKGSTVAIWS